MISLRSSASIREDIATIITLNISSVQPSVEGSPCATLHRRLALCGRITRRSYNTETDKKNNYAVIFALAGLILIILISGCIETGWGNKPGTSGVNASNDSKPESVSNGNLPENLSAALQNNLSQGNFSGDIQTGENFTKQANNTGDTNDTSLNLSIIENQTIENETTETEKPVTTNESKLIYLFGWDDVPGNDSTILTDFLRDKVGLYWVKYAKISKSEDNKTITLGYGKNRATIELDEEKNKIIIDIIQVTRREEYDFIFKNENGKLNIYLPEEKKAPQIKRIKFNIRALKSDDAQIIQSKLTEDLNGVIYAEIHPDKENMVLFDSSKVTKEQILKEAGYIKTPSGVVVMDLLVTLIEEVNCTVKDTNYYCCGNDNCKRYI